MILLVSIQELAGVAAKEISDHLLPAPRPMANCPSTGTAIIYHRCVCRCIYTV